MFCFLTSIDRPELVSQALVCWPIGPSSWNLTFGGGMSCTDTRWCSVPLRSGGARHTPVATSAATVYSNETFQWSKEFQMKTMRASTSHDIARSQCQSNIASVGTPLCTALCTSSVDFTFHISNLNKMPRRILSLCNDTSVNDHFLSISTCDTYHIADEWRGGASQCIQDRGNSEGSSADGSSYRGIQGNVVKKLVIRHQCN